MRSVVPTPSCWPSRRRRRNKERRGRPWARALGCLLLVAAGLVAPTAGVARAASPAEYRAAVASALAAVEAADTADEAARAAVLARVAVLLPAELQVDLGDGRSLTVADPALRAALAAGNRDAARAQLTALLAALDAAAAAQPPPADAEARLAAVLARPEFQPPAPGPLTRLLQPLLARLEAPLRPVRALWESVQLAWERFWRWVAAHFEPGTGGGPGWVFLALGGLVALGVAALLVGAFAGNVVSGAQVAAARAGARPSAAAMRARARALAEAGDYRAAVHELYLATLLALDERHQLRYRPDLTNREHLVAGHASPGVAATLEPLVAAFDRLWYSGTPVSADDWARFVPLADAAQAASADAPPVGTRPGAGATVGAS
ncbi:MAG TPA: DUF4129 domain-containing protein [Chloroflexota bacterium]|nr:DUF4129 domain-containing protein [Chloroflexota bacterium]